MEFARRVKELNFSATIQLSDKVRELENQGYKIIQLSGGQSCIATPDNIKLAAINALKSNQTFYSHSRGIHFLRKEIIKKYSIEYGTILDSDKNILITPGAKQAILYFMLAFINPGDEVLIPIPSWMSYAEIVKIAGGIPVFVECDKEKDFDINITVISAALTSKTKAIILNSPNNPTGQIFSQDKLIELSKLCVEKNIFLLCDEIYDQIVFDNYQNCSIAEINPSFKNSVLFNGFSKTYSMTGWRLGYVIAQDFVIDAMLKLQQNSVTCPATFAQFGAIEALNSGESFVKDMLILYKGNRDFVIAELNKLTKFDYICPKGSFYIFVDVSKICKDSKKFCLDLLERCKISAVPGIVFGDNAQGYMRINFAVDKQSIIEFVNRIKNAYELKSLNDSSFIESEFF